MIDISNFTVAKVLNERPSPSGVEYRCELEPPWLTADLVKKAKMGGVHIQNYKNDLIRANRLLFFFFLYSYFIIGLSKI
jgi:hypothetical protein